MLVLAPVMATRVRSRRRSVFRARLGRVHRRHGISAPDAVAEQGHDEKRAHEEPGQTHTYSVPLTEQSAVCEGALMADRLAWADARLGGLKVGTPSRPILD